MAKNKIKTPSDLGISIEKMIESCSDHVSMEEAILCLTVIISGLYHLNKDHLDMNEGDIFETFQYVKSGVLKGEITGGNKIDEN